MDVMMNMHWKRHFGFRFLGFMLALFLVVPLVMDDAVARSKKDSSAKGAIDAKTFEVLTKAQELTEAEKFDEAIATLDKIKDSGKLNSYAKSQMWNFYAYIYASQEKYKEAIEAYKKILAEPEATDGLKLTAKYTMAQLYFQIGDYSSVIQLMEDWLQEVATPTSTAHIILAQAYYQNNSYDNSLKNLLAAIDINRKAGKAIEENWLRLKAAIYYEKKDVKNTLKSYEELVATYPRVSYLKQIAGLHGELGNDRERLTTFDAIYEYGKLESSSEILNLAYMYLGQSIPYKASKVIETGIRQGAVEESLKNIETLANSWAQANEHSKAIPALEKAASLSDKGLLYARLAGVHFDAGDFKKAAIAAQKAEEKGGLKRRDNNFMLMGMALFNSKQLEPALQAFRQAKKSRKSYSAAKKWEEYTLAEIKYLKALKESKLQLAKTTEEALQAQENNVEAIGGNMLKSL